jgi:hypothetical protein
VKNTLLIFFPFISSTLELVEQIQELGNFTSFLHSFNEVLLARIPESFADQVLKEKAHLHNSRLEQVDEKKLDWAYPSYDVLLENLLDPIGSELKTYRKKVRKFCSGGIDIINLKAMEPRELRLAVTQITQSWTRTKAKGSISFRDPAVYELMDPYRALARLSEDVTSRIDGLILRREQAYIAFSFWEAPRKNRHTVPCFAALTFSYEKGLSEYLYRCVAERLTEQGYDRMCVGGSETTSLDQFKKKLNPIKTHRLRTIRLLA